MLGRPKLAARYVELGKDNNVVGTLAILKALLSLKPGLAFESLIVGPYPSEERNLLPASTSVIAWIRSVAIRVFDTYASPPASKQAVI